MKKNNFAVDGLVLEAAIKTAKEKITEGYPSARIVRDGVDYLVEAPAEDFVRKWDTVIAHLDNKNGIVFVS